MQIGLDLGLDFMNSATDALVDSGPLLRLASCLSTLHHSLDNTFGAGVGIGVVN